MTTITSSQTPRKQWTPGLSFWILVALVIGIFFGLLAPIKWILPLEKVGSWFIRLIKMLVAPLVFSTLVVGLCSAGHKNVGRLLTKALIWFWLATAVALAAGLGVANIAKPGQGVVSHSTPKEIEELKEKIDQAKKKQKNLVEQVVPESIVQALSENALLQIVFFSVLFGLALSTIGERSQVVVDSLKAIGDAMFKVTGYVMYTAPIGVGGAIAYAVGTKGVGVLLTLAKLVGSLYAALIIFVFALLLFVKLVTRIKISVLLKEIRSSLLIAFSTASSETVLPRVMRSLERLGVPKGIVGLVIPSGYSFNLDGTTLYLSLAAMFIAQAGKIEMGAGTQIWLMLNLLIASKGVAAVPRASLIVLASICGNFGLNVEWVATILGVDTFMDMARTSVNVLGNACASIVVAKWEKDLPQNAPLYTGVLPKETV